MRQASGHPDCWAQEVVKHRGTGKSQSTLSEWFKEEEVDYRAIILGVCHKLMVTWLLYRRSEGHIQTQICIMRMMEAIATRREFTECTDPKPIQKIQLHCSSPSTLSKGSLPPNTSQPFCPNLRYILGLGSKRKGRGSRACGYKKNLYTLCRSPTVPTKIWCKHRAL